MGQNTFTTYQPLTSSHMECNHCNEELSIKSTITLAVKGQVRCDRCGKHLLLKNRRFVRFLLAVLLLFVVVATYYLVQSRVELGLGFGWIAVSFLMPVVIVVLVFGVLVIPSMEVEAEN